jgi:hypothetical protein
LDSASTSTAADDSPSELDNTSSTMILDDSPSELDGQNILFGDICDFRQDDISNRVEKLVQKRLQSHADDVFEVRLIEAGCRKYFRVSDLDILIQSRGVVPNASDGRKQKIEAWRVFQDATVAWQRTASWMKCDEEELLKLQTRVKE